MILSAGTRLGTFEISGVLGKGGMGEVWRAKDTSLGREVALKVLPEDFADDPDRHARFEREAKLLASLNHPNIATLHALEHFDGSHVLVMELVEGEGLDEMIARGPIPLDDARHIALQIAEALGAAHEAGIVHRDLKPANVRIRPDGTVKVLDFGLAKSWEMESGDSSLSMSPTMTKHGTAAGVILGTAAYMSPEQARGKAVDRRADIWAYGVVLWEMLTGRKLFEGETVSDVLAAVLTRDFEPSTLPHGTPAAVQRLISRCLTREPKNRLQWIGDARLDLGPEVDEPARPEAVQRGRLPRWAGITSLVVAAISLILLASMMLRRPEVIPVPQTSSRFEITGMAVANQSHVAISPDGTRIIAYDASVVPPRLIWRALDEFEVQPVPGSIYGFNPFFAPDGIEFGFFAKRELCTTTMNGGTVRCLAPAKGFATGDWAADGTIVFSNEPASESESSGLWTVPSNGGAAYQLTKVDHKAGEISHTYPRFFSGGEQVLFTVRNQEGWQLAAVSAGGGAWRPVLANADNGHVVPSGHLVYEDSVAGGVHAVAFDSDSRELRGSPVRVIRNIAQSGDTSAGFDISDTGTVVYSASEQLAQGLEIVLVDRQGRAEPLIEELEAWTQPRVSPDGNLVVVRLTAQPDCHLWVFDINRRSLSRLTFDGDSHAPLWFGDSDRVAFSLQSGTTSRRDAMWLAADGSGELLPLLDPQPETVTFMVTAISPDERFVTLGDEGRIGRDDILVYDRDTGTVTPFVDSRFDEEWPTFSPDGRWLAYSSDETGRHEVYIRRFPEGDSKHLISTDGGRGPIWSADGQEVFFAEGNRMMAVSVRTDAGFSAGSPEALFGGEEYVWSRVRNYDVLPDGSGFAMVRSGGGRAPIRSLRVVTNWFEELERLAPAGKIR